MSGLIISAKKTDFNGSFQDISFWIPTEARNARITEIEIDPDNHQKFWVSMGNFLEDSKIFEVLSEGMYWNNITYDLPNIPVNNIKFDKETDMLFAATDVGLFYLTQASNFGADQTWERYGDFPLVIASDIKINKNTRELIVATYGRGIWRADLSCINVGGLKQISGTEVWNGAKSISQDIELLQGAKLTIKGETGIAKNAKITVNPGAKLIIDGGTLSNKCGGMWQGIILLGDNQHPQTEQYQGVLELKNGAVIENAETGVYVGAPNAYAVSAGGIVRVNNAVFRNCITALDFPYYRGDENRSYIYNSTFETTQDLYSKGLNPNAFIYMLDVGTIDIKGNTFKNTQELDQFNYFTQGKGIKVIDADFRLEPYCTNQDISPCPEEDLIKNRFENLYVAVDAQSTGSAFVCDINENEFINNWVSVSLNSVDDAEITSNDIDVYAAVNVSGQSGLYIVNSNGFHIEDNDIYTNSGNLPVGIFIRDCRSVNEIYRNRFSNLYAGIYVEGNNTALLNLPPNLDGLQMICNDFTDIPYDIYVAPSSAISTNQGSEDISAQNTFLPECSGTINEFNNQGNWQINYFAVNSPEYMPLCNNNVNLFRVKPNGCLSKLNGGMPSELISRLNDSIADTKSVLLAVTDGGDTEGLNETVENAENNEALKLRNELLSESPYLSDTVMINTTSVEDVLPALMVKQVLAVNPQAAKSDKVQNALDNRQNQLPQYMRDEINLGRDSLSHKEKLESKLSAFKNERENLINRKITRLLLDTTEQSLDTIENLLSSENNLHRVYQLVNFYISQNRIQDAQTLFADILQNFDLSNSLQTEYEKNAQFYNIKFELKNAEKSWFEMSNEQKAIIHTLAGDSTTNAGMLARAVLSLIENKDYGYPIPDIEEGGNKNANLEPENLSETFSVYPETVKDYFIIEYALAEKENPKDVRIVIFDDAGQKVRDFNLKTPANQFLIECENWKAGTYRCRKINKGKIAASEKVIIAGEYSENKNNKKISGINNSEQGKSFDIYPNPAKEYVFVTYNIEKVNPGKTVLQITDSKGSTVKIIKLNKSENRIKISTSDFKKGVYAICLKTGEKIINTKKIVVK